MVATCIKVSKQWLMMKCIAGILKLSSMKSSSNCHMHYMLGWIAGIFKMFYNSGMSLHKYLKFGTCLELPTGHSCIVHSVSCNSNICSVHGREDWNTARSIIIEAGLLKAGIHTPVYISHQGCWENEGETGENLVQPPSSQGPPGCITNKLSWNILIEQSVSHSHIIFLEQPHPHKT